MGGTSIKKASECLEVFIRSLPANSYFNIVRFGSKYEKLFENSIQYNESSFEKALKLVKQLKADLGGTELYQPLQVIFNEQNKMGQKQVFIMTDGEVSDPQPILNLVSQNSNENRCFTIGIGRGCDAGLVESIARLSGGKCDFVQEGDSISEKVIPQLQSSLFGIITSVQIHVENNDEFQMSPYPLPNISSKGSCIIYLRSKNKNKNENKFDKNFLITANYADENIEIPISEVNHSQNYEEDEFGCSEGRNIGKAILPLFAFNLLREYEEKTDESDEEIKNAIELSLSSGVLCKYTGYVGISGEKCSQLYNDEDELYEFDNACCFGSMNDDDYDADCCCAPMMDYNDSFDNMNVKRQESNSDGFYNMKVKRQESNSDGFDFMSVIGLQNFSGYWDDLDKLNNLLGLNISHIDGVNIANKEIERNCIATLIAIASLHNKALNERNVWIMIEQKAISWLQKILPDANIDKLIDETRILI